MKYTYYGYLRVHQEMFIGTEMVDGIVFKLRDQININDLYFYVGQRLV